MSQQEPDGPYVYQPRANLAPYNGRLWGVGGLPIGTVCEGFTREEAAVIVTALKSRVAAPTPETPSPLSRREAEQLALAHGTKTDRELATLLPTLSVEARIVVVLAKFVGGAVSRHYDGENNAKVAESRVAVDLFQRLKPWLAGAVSHPQPEPRTTTKDDDDHARVDGRGLSAGFGTAGLDAGTQDDSAETEKNHAG